MSEATLKDLLELLEISPGSRVCDLIGQEDIEVLKKELDRLEDGSWKWNETRNSR